MQSEQEQTHQKWMKWLGEMNKHVKYDVKLYRLKNIYEKSLENPRTHPNQDGIGQLDITLTYIYNYDGGVIGRGGKFEVIENDDGTIHNMVDKLYNGYPTFSEEKSQERLNLIKHMIQNIQNIQNNHDGFRIGLYTRRNGFPPSFYVISTYDENPTYYAQTENGLYDADECCLYYSIRYDISYKTYYVLSGMREWSDDIFSEIIMPPCPSSMDEIDELRYTREYLDGVDLDLIYNDIVNQRSIGKIDILRDIATKYGLSYCDIEAIANNKL